MFSNLKQISMLMLLASAASPVLAAPAPVSDLNSTTSNSSLSSSRSGENSVERLERLIQNSNLVQARMQQQIDSMTQEISDLRGQIEKNNYDMQQMVTRQRELFVEVDKLREQVNSQPAPSADLSGVKDDASSGTFSTNASEQQAYQNAVDLILKKRDYNGAIAAFQQFQKDYPDSSFMPNTHYWLGQLFFAKQQDKDAAKSFATVLTFQDSNKRPDALVKLGDIAKRNNNAAQAKKYYQQVIDEYPNSSSANLAKEQLK